MILLASSAPDRLAGSLLMPDGLPAGAARGTSAGSSAADRSSLGVHLVRCNLERGQLFTLRTNYLAVIGLLTSRVITVLMAVVFLYVTLALVY